MYSKVLNIYKYYQKRQYHAMHKRIAENKLQHLERTKGKLSEYLRRQCDSYAKEVLGSKKYAPWLYVYTSMHNKFKEGWMPDNYYGEIVVPKLKGNYGSIANLKTLHAILFNSSSFPDLFYYVNGQWLTNEYDVVTAEHVQNYIISNPNKYVYKIDNSQSGKGVSILEDSFKIKNLMIKGNGVLQSFINQHEFFDDIISNSVATLRMTTAINQQGKVSLVGAYLRVGKSKDNIVLSASGYRIPIDLKNANLSEIGYDNNLTEYQTHPDTGYVFKNKVVPNFFDIEKELIALHYKVPFVRIIGWDVIIDKYNKTKIMEWNGMHNTIYFDEMTKGPIFKGYGFENLWKENSHLEV